MAEQTRNVLKSWFVTGATPTQQQFWDLLDSYFHRTDGLAMEDVSGLVTALQSKVDKTAYEASVQGVPVSFNADGTYSIPESWLLEMIIPYYSTAGTMKLSTVASGNEDVMPSTEISEGWNAPIRLDLFAPATKTLYIAGIPSGSKIIFFKRQIKMTT